MKKQKPKKLRLRTREEIAYHSLEKNRHGYFFHNSTLEAMNDFLECNEYPIFQDHIDLVFRVYTWAFEQGYEKCWHDNGLCCGLEGDDGEEKD